MINSNIDKTSTSKHTKMPQRCDSCSKKISLMAFDCKCGKHFCISHKNPEDHCCTFDYKEYGKNELSSKLVIKDLSHKCEKI
jgi:hypothetical protein